MLHINKGKFRYRNDEFQLNDLYTEDLYQFCDKTIEEIHSDLCIINEVYLNTIQPVQAIILFLNKNKIELIEFVNPNLSLFSLIKDAADVCKIKTIGTPILFKIRRRVIGYINVLATMNYLIWQMLIRPYADNMVAPNQEFSIIRTPAAKKKMEFLEDVYVKHENFKDKKNIYNCVSRRKRVKWVLKAWYSSYHELKKIEEMLIELIGKYSATESFYYYSKRIVHTLLYKYMLEEYFHKNARKLYYTGNNLDRFALLEERIAKKYRVKIVCIPHGLEYGFRLPHCFIGDVFYTTSKQAFIHLYSLYNTSKFVYDPKIAQKIFSVTHDMEEKRRIVFFTEPREVYVNLRIIDELLKKMEQEKMSLSIKLHPKDQRSDYVKYENKVEFMDNFNKAISKNICFSRKSTTLLEAVYNESKVGAILLNPKDKAVFHTFPSLQDKKIRVFYSISDLYEWIKGEWERRNSI